jgi:hypothetical protein
MPKGKKQISKNSDSVRVNKSAWIRNQSATLSAKQVLEKASAEGIQLSLAQIYTARSSAKTTSGKPGRPIGSTNLAGRDRATSDAGGNSKSTFQRMALAIGLDRAEAYLAELQRRAQLL